MSNRAIQNYMNESKDLYRLFRSLFEKKMPIVIFSITIFFIGMIYILRLPTQYKANVLLQIQHTQHNSLGALTNNNNVANEEESIAMQMALIRSNLILGPVIQTLGLDIEILPYKKPFFHFGNKSLSVANIVVNELQVPAKYLNKPLHLKVISIDSYKLFNKKNKLLMAGKVGQLHKNKRGFEIKIDKLALPIGSELLIKKYSESEIINKILAKLVVNELTGTSFGLKNAGLLQLSFSNDNPETVIKIVNQIAIVAQKKDMELKAFAANQTLKFLNQELPIIQASLRSAEAKLNIYRATSGKIDIKLQSEYLLHHLSNLDKQMEEIRLKKTDLSEQNTIFHPFIISLARKYKELNKEREEVFNKIKKLPADDQVALNLARDVNVKSKLYMVLLDKIHSYEVIKAGIVSDIRILSFANNLETPQPKRFLVVGIASLLVGAILGCFFNLGRKILNRRIDDPNWIEQNLDIENLITIPYIKKQKLNTKLLQDSSTKSLMPLMNPNSDLDSALESLRIFRTILQNKLYTVKNNIIAIMSLSQNTGKTFITVNLASLFALAGKKVLLIDADIQNGHIHYYLPSSSTQGLTDIFNCGTETSKLIIRSNQHDKLFFLPKGSFLKNPADLLVTDRFKQFLLDISKQYEYVFINTSLISLPDTMLIASLAGINLLIMGANMHESKEVEKAVTVFRRAGLHITGSIFNYLIPSKMNINPFILNPKN